MTFERIVNRLLDRAGRIILEWTYNHMEPENLQDAAAEVKFEDEYYRRKNRKTRKIVSTLFGKVVLYRRLYEACELVLPALHPLEAGLGLVAGLATPALADRLGRAAAAGSQAAVLLYLQQEFHVKWACHTLRKVLGALSAGLSRYRHTAQVRKLLVWLEQAEASKGRCRPVLSAGRDGIHLPMRGGGYREGATATLSVLDRRGKRLGTVYLGRMPEEGQTTLSHQLTALIEDVLDQWCGPLPRLAYVTDAGWHPSEYFQTVLKTMRHPRTGDKLAWQWIVDFYHACQYISKLAEALFETPAAGSAWARRMRRCLKTEPHGIFRVLHSAAALRSLSRLSASREKAYQEAYGYLKRHRKFMKYAEYRRVHLPIGSGVTEAACKTVFTQRFKQSGMTWTIAGGQTIVDLRVIYLSGIWDDVFQAWLGNQAIPELRIKTTKQQTKTVKQQKTMRVAA